MEPRLIEDPYVLQISYQELEMTANIAIPKPPYSIGALPVLVALVAVFLLGGLSGYLVRPATAAPAAALAQQRPAAACPASTHVVVWYTARTWACVADSAG